MGVSLRRRAVAFRPHRPPRVRLRRDARSAGSSPPTPSLRSGTSPAGGSGNMATSPVGSKERLFLASLSSLWELEKGLELRWQMRHARDDRERNLVVRDDT